MVLLPLHPSARRRIGRGGRSRHHLRFRGHGCGRTTTGAMVRPGRSNLAGSALCLEQAVQWGWLDKFDCRNGIRMAVLLHSPSMGEAAIF